MNKNNFLLIAKFYQLDIISVSSKKKKKEMTLCSQIIQWHTDEKNQGNSLAFENFELNQQWNHTLRNITIFFNRKRNNESIPFLWFSQILTEPHKKSNDRDKQHHGNCIIKLFKQVLNDRCTLQEICFAFSILAILRDLMIVYLYPRSADQLLIKNISV